MSKIIFLQNRRRDSAPAPDAPKEPARILQRPRSQAERDRELRELAARCFAEDLARSEARLAQMIEDGVTGRKLQSARDEVAYYKRQIADNTPAEEEPFHDAANA